MKPAEIKVEGGKLIVTAQVFVDRNGDVRMLDKEAKDIDGIEYISEVPLSWLIRQSVGTTQRLTITVEPASTGSGPRASPG